MIKVIYCNKELKNNIDFSKGLTDDDYEIKQQTIVIENKDLDYYLDIIHNAYGKFGEVDIDELPDEPKPSLPSTDQTAKIQELENQLLQTQSTFTDLITNIVINIKEGSV